MSGVFQSIGRVVLGVVIGAALARGDTGSSRPCTPSTQPPPALAATISDAEQAEDIFAYGVVADVGRRSAWAIFHTGNAQPAGGSASPPP
jgi:hypothetical protein